MLVAVVGANGAERPRLAVDGKANVTIVLPLGSGEETQLASSDLSRCLSKALGVDVPTVNTLAQAKTPLTIVIGDVSANLPLQRDGYAIRTYRNSVHITGVSDYGIANGIYTFLMDYVGVRWFSPGDLYEVIPKNPGLTLPDVNVAKNPDLAYRVFAGVFGDIGTKWLRRSRTDINTERLPYFGFGHNLNNIIRASVYGNSHPEYFAFINGKRQVPAQDDDQNIQPCFTNPEVIALTARVADEFFKKNPSRTTFSLCINDGTGFCQCPNCAALDQPLRNSISGAENHSDSYIHFVEQVALIVQKTNPGKYLGCYAYWGVELTPRNITKLPDNVSIALTQDTSQQHDPEYKRKDRDLWAAWSKITKHLGKYDYYGLGWLTPRYYPRIAADDLKYVYEHSGAGLYCEMYPNWCVTAPQIYLAARIGWDMSLNPDRVLDEYYTMLYGPAASQMKEFYSILERYWMKPRHGYWFEGFLNIPAEMQITDERLIDDAWLCLLKARQLTTGVENKRVADIADHFGLTYDLVKGYTVARRLAQCKIANRADMEKLVAEAFDSLHKIDSVMAVRKAKWLTDVRYNHTYHDDQDIRFKAKFTAWQDEVKTSVVIGLRAALDQYHVKFDADEYDAVCADLNKRLIVDSTANRLGIRDALEAAKTSKKE